MLLLRHLFLETMPLGMPSSDEWRPPMDPPETRPNHGRVLWWNCAMGLGVIMTTEGVARIHWKNVKDADGFVRFKKDDLVTYDELGTPFQSFERATKVKLEAFGVHRLG